MELVDGSAYQLSTIETTAGTSYQWYFENNLIEGATEATFDLSFNTAEQGSYTCQMTNSSVDDLTITRAPYIITERPAKTETEILSFSIAEQLAVVDVIEKTVSIELPFGSDLTSLIAHFSLSDGASAFVGDTFQESGIATNNFSGDLVYTVTAEDGTTEMDWLVNVTLAPNHEAQILSFSLPEQTQESVVDSENFTIACEVEAGIDLNDLAPEFTLSENATAFIGTAEQESGTTTNNFRELVTYTIVAEDGTSQDWQISVANALGTETDFVSFELAEQTSAASIDLVNHMIYVEVQYGTGITALVPTFELSHGTKATVDGEIQESGLSVQDFTDGLTYELTSEDGQSMQEWSVAVTFAPNHEAQILSFSLPEQTQESVIDSENFTIACEVEAGVDLIVLIPEFTLSENAVAFIGAEEQESGYTTNDFRELVTYTIVAEDGTSQDWQVSVSNALGTETDFVSFELVEQTSASSIDLENHVIEIEVQYGTDITALMPAFELSHGTQATVDGQIQESGLSVQDFTDGLIYELTSEDGRSIQSWLVELSVEQNSETDFIFFSFGDSDAKPADIDSDLHIISIEITIGSDITNLNPQFEVSGGATTTLASTSQDFSLAVFCTVTAENGTTQQWQIVVNKISDYIIGSSEYAHFESFDAAVEFLQSASFDTDVTFFVEDGTYEEVIEFANIPNGEFNVSFSGESQLGTVLKPTDNIYGSGMLVSTSNLEISNLTYEMSELSDSYDSFDANSSKGVLISSSSNITFSEVVFANETFEFKQDHSVLVASTIQVNDVDGLTILGCSFGNAGIHLDLDNYQNIYVEANLFDNSHRVLDVSKDAGSNAVDLTFV